MFSWFLSDEYKEEHNDGGVAVQGGYDVGGARYGEREDCLLIWLQLDCHLVQLLCLVHNSRRCCQYELL